MLAGVEVREQGRIHEDCVSWKTRARDMGWTTPIENGFCSKIDSLGQRFFWSKYNLNQNQLACIAFAVLNFGLTLKPKDKAANLNERVVLEIPTGKGKSRVLLGIMCAMA